MDNLSCFECKKLIHGGIRGLSTHMRSSHGFTLERGMGGNGFICGQSGCLRNYKYFKNLQQHILSNHVHDVQVEANERQLANPPENHLIHDMEMDEHEPGGVNGIQNVDQEVEEETENANTTFDLRSAIIKVICQLHACKSMTGAMIKIVLEEFESLIHQHSLSLKEKIANKLLVGQVVSQALINDVNEIFDIGKPFEGLKNYKQQIQAIVTHSYYIESLEILLGYRMDMRFNRKSCRYYLTQVPETYQYVPIIEVLRMVLSNEKVRRAIDNEQPSPNGILGSFIDGECFRAHPFFQKFPHAIRLRIYYDELEITNPLGSKTGIHKLGVFYFQIGNLPNQMNSALDSIHILAIFCYPDVSYGFDRILSPFFDDLARLESDDGVLLEFEDGDYILRASIESFCGDGAAVHAVNEFLCPAANLFCRMCTYSRAELHQGSLQLGQPRTLQLYEQHLQLLVQSDYSDASKTATGLKGPSPWGRSKFFHPLRNKIFDNMHEYLNGICPMVVKLVLHQYIVVDKKFDVRYLNNAIKLFDYGFTEMKNKPSANFTDAMLSKRDHSLSQKAMQMWCLVRALPFLLNEKIDEDDVHMELIIQLLRVMEIIFAPRIPSSILTHEEDLYEEFLLNFKELFPNVHFINKLHHGQHARECIEWSGPLELYNCAAFERKHEELKMRARTVHNFKNPPKTLVRISQCVQSAKWSSGNVETGKVEVLNGKSKKVQSCKSSESLIQMGLVADEKVFCATSVKINGIEFRKNLFVVLEKAEARDDDLLVFGQIEEVIVLDEKVDGKHFLTLDMNELRLMGIQMGPAKDLLEIIDNLKNQVIDLTAPIKEPENSTIVLDECYSQEVILANGMPQGEELESCEETPLMKKSKLELPAQSCEETPPIKKIKLELSAKTSSTINSERADTSKQSSTRSRQGVNSPSNSNGHHKSVKVDEDEFTRYGTVKDTLNSSPQGKEVVKILQGADSALPVGARKSLVRLVIAELVQVQGTIYPPHEAKEALAKALITEFPFLKDCRRPFGFERFYDPVTKKGFFHWRLQTLQRKAPKDQKMYNKSESAVKSSSSNTSLELPLLTEEENSAEISLLKRKSGDDGHRLVIENGLRKTFPNRRDWIKKKAPSSKEILHVYSHFQSYRGDMVDLEFFLIAKSEEKGDKFLKMFSSYYVPRIFSYCKSHREDLLRKHSDVVNGDLKAVLILIDLLPIPNGMYNCNKNKAKATEKPRKEKSAKNKASKRQVKPGKQSAKEAASQKNLSIYEYLIENVSNQSQIENFIQNKIKKSSESIQPYIICTEKTNYFVVIDGIFLSRKDTTDFVGAFDLLFKVYYVMNLEYPIPLLYFYYYVESSIYEINDCVVNTVSDLHVALKFTKVMDFESVDEDDDEESDDSSDGDDNSD